MSTRGTVTIINGTKKTVHYMKSDAYPDFAEKNLKKAVMDMKGHGESYLRDEVFISKANGLAGFEWIEYAEYGSESPDTEVSYIEHKWIVDIRELTVKEDLAWRQAREKYTQKWWESHPEYSKHKPIKVRSYKRRT